MTAPRTYTVAKRVRIGNRIGMIVLGIIAATFAGIASLADLGGDAVPVKFVMGGIAVMLGTVAWTVSRQLRSNATTYTLRADGIEILASDSAPQFIGWGQITDIKFDQMRSGFSLYGPGDQLLGRISTQIVGLGELTNAIVARGVLPKRRMVMPFRAEKSYPTALRAVFVLLLVVSIVPLIGFYQDARSLVGLVFPVILGILAFVDRYFSPRAIIVDQNGVTVERGAGDRKWRWDELDGGALAILRGPKGSISIASALRRKDGKWEVLRLPGSDPVEILAAIAATGPDRIIAAPDRLSLTSGSPFGGTYREPTKADDILKYL